MKLLETMRGYSRKRKFLTTIAVLIVLDQLFVWGGHGMLMWNDVDFEARWERADINPSAMAKGDKTICDFEYILLIYGYQTCFEPNVNTFYPDRSGYSFIYSKPRPKLTLWFRGDTQNNYYFETTFADHIKYIRVDGAVFNNYKESLDDLLSKNDES